MKDYISETLSPWTRVCPERQLGKYGKEKSRGGNIPSGKFVLLTKREGGKGRSHEKVTRWSSIRLRDVHPLSVSLRSMAKRHALPAERKGIKGESTEALPKRRNEVGCSQPCHSDQKIKNKGGKKNA